MTDPNSRPDFTAMDFDNFENVRLYLITYGYHHLLGIEPNEAVRIDEASTDTDKMIARFQSFFWEARGIQPDGLRGLVTNGEMIKPRCACEDIPDPNQASGDRWDEECQTSIKVWCDKSGLSGMSQARFEELWYEQFKEHRRVCNFDFKIVGSADEAHYIGKVEGMGGGTLAWSEFPSSCSGQSVTKSNRRVDWDEPLFTDTSLHEQGHGLGLPHGPAGSVMYWTVDREYGGKWQNWDQKQLRRRYGDPVAVDVPPDPPGPIQPIAGHEVFVDNVRYVPAGTSPGPGTDPRLDV